MAILRYNLFRAQQLMVWRLRLSDKTFRKFAELPIYCQRQKCSPGNVVSGSIRYADIRGGFAGNGASNETVVIENGDFRFIRSLSSQHFTYMATRQLSGDTTVNDIGHISRSLDCFTSNFSKTVTRCVIRQKLLYRQLIGNHTLALDWCHFYDLEVHLKVISA